MNHIARLQTDLSLAIAAITAGDEAIQALRVHLNGDKFRGVETDGAGDRIRLPAPAHFGKSGISADCFVVVAMRKRTPLFTPVAHPTFLCRLRRRTLAPATVER